MFDENPTPDEGASIESSEAPVTTEAEEKPAVEPAEAKPADSPTDDATPGREITLSDAAQIFDVNEDDLELGEDGKVYIRSKVDGESGKVKLSDLKATHQKKGHFENETKRVVQERAQLKEQIKQASNAARVIEHEGSLALNQLNEQYKSINWAELRETDETRFNTLERDFEREYNRINSQVNRAKQNAQNVSQQVLREEYSKLPTVIPEWTDTELASKEKTLINQYVNDNKVDSELLNSAHGVAALRKAMLYDKSLNDKAEVVSLVRKAPKVSKPGAAETPSKPVSDAELFYS